MSRKSSGRTQLCGKDDAATRLGQARKFLELAELAATDPSEESSSVAVALAVLAGIAASDAACCSRLGARSRGQDHHLAEALLRQVTPGGPGAATTLRRLLDAKDAAHYGLTNLGGHRAKLALGQAAELVEFAATTLGR